MIFAEVWSANGNEVVLLMLTSAELTDTCVDKLGVASLPRLVEVVSLPHPDRHGLLIFMVVCSVTGNEVVLLMLTFTELTDTCVDACRIVSLSLLVEVVSVPYVDRHGVVIFVEVWSANGNIVVLLMLRTAELTDTSVDERGVVSLPLLVEVVSIPYVDRRGMLIFIVVCSVTRNEVVLLVLISAELKDTCVDERRVASLSLLVEVVSVSYVVRRGVLTLTVVSSVNGVLIFMVVCSVTGNEVVLLMLTSAELTDTCVDKLGVVSLPRLVEVVSV